MGIKRIKVYEDLPIEAGKTYMTKFQTKEMFTVTKVSANKSTGRQIVAGIYEKHPGLGECPIDVDRLIADKREVGTTDVCDHCGHSIEEKSTKKHVEF